MANQADHRDLLGIKIRRAVRRAASCTPHAICWRCGRTLAQHEPHRNGKPAEWQGGHTIDGVNGPAWFDVTRRPPKGLALIAPEASTCNTSAGARTRWTRAGTGYDWP